MKNGKMKQVWLTGRGGPFQIREVPIPTPGAEELLIKMKTSSICNQTDLNTIKGLHPAHEDQMRGVLPHHLRMYYNKPNDELSKFYTKRTLLLKDHDPVEAKMGHEGMGVVVEVGPTVEAGPGQYLIGENFKPGDRVAFDAGRCSFAEYAVSTRKLTVHIPDSLDDEEGSLFEPAMSVYQAIIQAISVGDTLCILGQGALGLIATQLGRAMGASKIIVSDPIEMKRNLAKKFGADITIDPSTQNVVHEIEELTDGKGVDVVIEAAGVPETMQVIPYIAGFGGHVSQIGACCDPVLIDWAYIHFKGLQVYSCPYYSHIGRTFTRFNRMTKLMSEKMDLKSLITHRYYAFEDIEKAFKDIKTGMVVKGMFILK